jgi:hypothetical protein
VSYDLVFTRRRGGPTLDVDAFRRWFGERPCYRILGDDRGQAWFENEDTGVYFSFDWAERPHGDPDPEAPEGPVAFNVNYGRPSVFALEACPEIEAFVEHFSLDVDDPQTSGMGRGRFTREGFLRGWRAGNVLACRVLSERGVPLRGAPTDQLERVWRWNLGRAARQAEEGEDRWVPPIHHFELDGRLHTAVIWSDGLPVLLPRVEVVLCYREELADGPRNLGLARWGELEPLLAPFETVTGPVSAVRVAFDRRPPALGRFIRGLPVGPPAPRAAVLRTDQLVDEEALAEACSGR